MSFLSQIGIKEPSILTPQSYGRRIHFLALIYVGLFAISIAGNALLIWKYRLFVTLSQRSNVETLTLAFFLVFFTYIAVLSIPGVKGSLLILYANAVFGPAKIEKREKRKLSFMKESRKTLTVALNNVVELDDKKNAPILLKIEDEHGSLGLLRFKGARLEHLDPFNDGSNTLFAYAVEQLNLILEKRGVESNLDIVEWKKIDDEETEKFLSLVQFACNLEKALSSPDPLWPRTLITEQDLVSLEPIMSPEPLPSTRLSERDGRPPNASK